MQFALALMVFSSGCEQSAEDDGVMQEPAVKVTEGETIAESAAGKLLIVGGALRSDNQSIYRAFIESMPDELPEVAIIPAASGRPSHYARQFADDLRAYGFTGEIRVLPIAVRDDPHSEVDEGGWRDGGRDRKVAKQLKRAGGIWFVGGDQGRLTQTMLESDGGDTPVLAAIRAQLRKGAIVGGTSAGAAIMSRTMIAAGDSLSALTLPGTDPEGGMDELESGRLVLAKGLGFLPLGIVDQHFDRKGRLGRLIRALAEPQALPERVGFGVDEDTAVLVDLAALDMQVLGAGNLVLVDARHANFSTGGGPFAASGLQLSVLSSGDQYNWSTGEVQVTGTATVGHEATGYVADQGAGLALPNQRLDHLLGFSLLDNSETGLLRRYAFDESSGRGVLFEFRQTEDSRGFWRYGSGTKDQYSLLGVELEVKPVQVSISPLLATAVEVSQHSQ
ncbi:cyanophycinase [Microbulbifer sp. SA54]|uniref:cyanophycinase n=1 Tax=Microbulbifer sp. SA54 TaxID=3401577 RepID=UPI003AAA49C5